MAGSVGRDRALEATAESAQLVAEPNAEPAPPRPQVRARPAASEPTRRLVRGLSLPLRGEGRPVSPLQSRAPVLVVSNDEHACQERGRSPQRHGLRPASTVQRSPEPRGSWRRREEYQRDLQHRDHRYRSPQRLPQDRALPGKRSPRQRSPHQRSPRPSPPRHGRGSPAHWWDGRRGEDPSPLHPQSAGSGGRRGRRRGSAHEGNGRGQGSAVDRASNMFAAAVHQVQAGREAAHVHVSVTTEPPSIPAGAAAAPMRAPILREYLPAAAARGPFRNCCQAPGYPAPQNPFGQTPGQMAAFPPHGVPTAPLPTRAGRDPTLSMCRMWNLAGTAEGVASLQLAVYEAMPRTFPHLALDLHAAALNGTLVDTLRFSAELLHTMAGCLLSMPEAEGAGLYSK
ncbi:unnamed protein product [Closterium sp. Naga37s-1]|nr:unnamed protein product [Closterium sp. Naga37s-1]